MNNTKQYDLVVNIGRFQPLHEGHRATIKQAGRLSSNILILIGSAVGPRTPRNPWTYNERISAIRNSISFYENNIYFGPLRDYSYNDNQWIRQVGDEVAKVAKQLDCTDEPRIAVIGHDKDHSSYYLNYFPQWDYIEMPAYPSKEETIDSTRIRQLMFSNQVSFTDGVVAGSQVRDFIATDEFKQLQQEWVDNEKYKDSWKAAPYEVIFTTVDAVVEQSGHILLVQRGRMPGKGLWAMPGGFLDPTEKILDGIIRELREETRLKVPAKVLRGSITHQAVFDDVNRSARGRTITHTALIQLDDAAELPRVKGNDDAMDARWFSLAEFEEMQSVMFEDHFSIIRNMISRA